MDEKQIAEAVAAYVEDNLHEDLCLESIADKLGYSKFHINRVFAVVTGCTIYKYIQMRRLTEAARQLVETEKPIVEIAYEAHYNSQQALRCISQGISMCSGHLSEKRRILSEENKGCD